MKALPETHEQLTLWVLSAPVNGYDYWRPRYSSNHEKIRLWVKRIQERWPNLVEFERTGFYQNSMIRTWTIRIAGISIGTIPQHEIVFYHGDAASMTFLSH